MAMKRIILFLLTSIICVLSFSQGIYIEGKGYKGYIFPQGHAVCGFPPNPNSFTPSKEDIEDVEQILKQHFQDNFKNRSVMKYYGYPRLNRKTLKNYIRQYVGVLAENGNKVIFINFIHKKDEIISLEDIKKDLIYVLDGGTYYWRIHIDITLKKIINMEINGVA